MRKKIISLVLALAMLATSACAVFAEPTESTPGEEASAAAETSSAVDIKGLQVSALVNFFANSTPAEKEKRLELLTYIRAYMGDADRNMVPLINAVKNKDFASLSLTSETMTQLESFFESVVNNDNIYPAALLALDMIYAIPEASRKAVLDGFDGRVNGYRVKYTIADEENEEAVTAALNKLYTNNAVYPEALREKLSSHEDMDALAILNLFTAWKNTIRFTDGEDGKLAVYDVNSAYGTKLLEAMGNDFTIDGAEITDAKQVAQLLADAVNASYSADVIKDMKTVLADLGIYVAVVPVSKDTRASSIKINNRRVDLSTNINKPAKIDITTSSFTVEATAQDGDATVQYAFIGSSDDPSDWTWRLSLDSVSLRIDEKEKIAIRVSNGGEESIYYVTVSRPDKSDSNTSNRNRVPSLVVDNEKIPTPTDTSNKFADTASHWGKTYINAVVEKGLFTGYDTGKFEPNRGITRQEMAVVLVRLLGANNELGSVTETSYTDNGAIAPWAYNAVALLASKGIYLGYDDGEFKPERVLSREEIVALAMRIYGYSDADTVMDYSDVEYIGEWARKAIGQATNLGIISGRDNGLFAPNANVTRAEAAKILYNYMYLKGI